MSFTDLINSVEDREHTSYVLNFLTCIRLVSLPIWSVLVNVPYTFGKNIYSTVSEWSFLSINTTQIKLIDSVVHIFIFLMLFLFFLSIIVIQIYVFFLDFY